MISKRLINVVPKTKTLVVRNVFYQWCGLIMNITMILVITSFVQNIFIKTLDNVDYIILACVMVMSLIVRYICFKKAIMISDDISKQVKYRFRELIYNKLSLLNMNYQENIASSEVVQLAVEGVDQLEIYFGNYLPQFIYSLLAPLTLFVVLSFINFRAAIVLLLCVPLIPMTIVAVQKFAKKLLSKYWGEYTTLGDSFLENLQGLTTLKIYNADQVKHDQMNVQAERFRKITMKVLMMQLNSIALMDGLAYGGAALGVILALLGVNSGSLSLGGGLAIILLSADFYIPMRLLGSFFHIAMNGMAASDKLFSLLDLEVIETNVLTKMMEDSIDIENLSFSYDDNRLVLDDINLTFKKGEVSAVVGESGSGKSTLAAILMGSYNTYNGKILVDGEEGLPKMTYVGYNSYLFKDTIRNNLNIGKVYDDIQLWDALSKVNMKSFLEQEGGLDFELKEGASNISGGQRQRLALARALLLDSSVYVFDEATSNIDVESENEIMQIIKDLSKTKTIILITHRLANVTDAKIIYVLEDGKLVESGNHNELVKSDSVYQKLWSSQVSLEEYSYES